MTAHAPILSSRWPTRFVVLLLALCALYASYRAVHLAIIGDEVDATASAHQESYWQLVRGDNWNSQGHLLNTLLAKPCVEFLPFNEIVAGRIPSLLGLAFFLWGVWRIGAGIPSGTTRVLLTLALLSNAFLLDFFGLNRGYGLALGFTLLALSFLIHTGAVQPPGGRSARRTASLSLWLAFGAALSNMAFVYFYAALLAVLLWLGWRERLRIRWWISALLLVLVYVPRVLGARHQNFLVFGGDTGFVHDTIGSLVRCSFYDRSVSATLVGVVSTALALLVCLLAYWSHREQIRSGFLLSLLGILVAAICTATNVLLGVKYLEERAALFLVPLLILNVGVVAAWSRARWIRVLLFGLLLLLSGIGISGVNLSHTLTWRGNADIPSALLALRETHEKTGRHIVLAASDSMKWTIWYNVEHLLGLRSNKPLNKDSAYLRTYEWFTAYEWKAVQVQASFGDDHPFIPGTTHVLLDRADTALLAAHLAKADTLLKSCPASDTTLFETTSPEQQGVCAYTDGRKYVGEYSDAMPNGQGTVTWPDGRKYVGEFKDGQLNGRGAGTLPNGAKYEGDFKDGMPHGRGTAVLPDGQTYAGEFRDGLPNGRGTSTWPDGRKYTGEFRLGRADGQGTLLWPDGRTYAGEFHELMPNGIGKMTYPDGRVDEGVWKQGQFVGAAPH